MGDFNAKIGSDNKGREQVMGRPGEGEINANGEIFVDICAFNSMVTGGSMFPHKRIHKATWVSPDHYTGNQIDHICIKKRFRRSVQDVKVYRGADVALDHHLVVGTLRLKLKKYNTRNPKVTPRYNTRLLQDPPTRRAFQIALSNRYQVLADLEDEGQQHSIEHLWRERKRVWLDTSKVTLGSHQNQHKEWIATETLNKVESRRKLKDKINNSRTRGARREAQSQYNKANHEVRKHSRRDKRKSLNDLAKEAETAAKQHRMKDLYDLTKKLAGKKSSTSKPIKDKHGITLTKQEDQLRRLGEYFEELLSRPPPPIPVAIPEAEFLLDVNTAKPSNEEIAKAIHNQKNGKAPGPDGISAEILKGDVNIPTQMLYEIYAKIWEEETIPEDWREGHLVKIPKKGDLANCNNYRGITMLSVPGKILSRESSCKD